MHEYQSDRYINRISSTILMILKLIEGAGAAYGLYQIIRVIYPFIQPAIKGTADFMDIMRQLMSAFGLDAIQDPEVQQVLGAVSLPFIIYALLFLIVIIGLILVVIEAVSLLLLRFGRRGASAVKIIHRIYFFGYILLLVLFVYDVIQYIRAWPELEKAAGSSSGALIAWNVLFVIGTIICFVLLLLQTFYHNDVSYAVGTVQEEILSDQPCHLKKTHLSGISLFFALPYVLFLVSLIVSILEGNTAQRISDIQSDMQSMLTIVAITATALKYIAVFFCNRNLKRAR